MTNPKYVFWYTDEYHATSVDCLIEYCNLKPPYQERAPILFSSSRVDKTKNNIFFIRPIVLGSGLEELLDFKDEIKWCDDNDITVIYENSWESLEFCLPKNNIQEIQDIIPKKFKIFCNFLKDDIQLDDPTIAPFLKYAVDVMFFPMYLGYTMELMKNDTWNRINLNQKIKKKYLFSLLCGEIRKPHRYLTLAGIMAENLLDDSFYTTFIRKHNETDEDLNNPLFPSDNLNEVQKEIPNFKYYDYLNDNYYDKILVNKLFDLPHTDSNEIAEGLFYDEDFRIPIQMHESYFNIVFETLAFHNLCFFTEKTFKPILVGMPFIICGTLHQNQYLQSLGFEIFPEIFDYSFEDEDHDHDYLPYIEGFIAEIKRVSELPLSVFEQPSVLAKVKHNKELITRLGSKDNIRKQLIEILS